MDAGKEAGQNTKIPPLQFSSFPCWPTLMTSACQVWQTFYGCLAAKVASGVLLQKTAIGAPVAADIARMAGAASPAAGRLATRVIHGAGAAVYGRDRLRSGP